MPRYVLQTMTADALPMLYDGSFFTIVRGRALVFDDDDAAGKRSRAACFFDKSSRFKLAVIQTRNEHRCHAIDVSLFRPASIETVNGIHQLVEVARTLFLVATRLGRL